MSSLPFSFGVNSILSHLVLTGNTGLFFVDFRNDIRHVTQIVTKRPKCPTCKNRFRPPARGRPAVFCSAACRQKAYRSRARYPVLKILTNDLRAFRDGEARKRGAVKVLEDLGYIVHLERGVKPGPPNRSRAKIRLVED
jgi:hypothetical protein